MDAEERAKEAEAIDQRINAQNTTDSLQKRLNQKVEDGGEGLDIQIARDLAPVLYVLSVAKSPLTAQGINRSTMIELGNHATESSTIQGLQVGILEEYIQNIDKSGIYVYKITKTGRQLLA